MYMHEMRVFCALASCSLPAVGLSSLSRLRGAQGARVDATVQVRAPAGLRGAHSGHSKSRELALFSRDRFPPSHTQAGRWKPHSVVHGEGFAFAVTLHLALLSSAVPFAPGTYRTPHRAST